ncbi:MAG: class I SAM-dependent methyltransferase [Nitrospirae bacterium]|nr:class I SAM-dependent methyltransferase [Nitrospirota bacterium]
MNGAKLLGKLFRLVFHSSADAYAFAVARRYYARDRQKDAALARRIRELGDVSAHFSFFRQEGNGLLHLEAQLARLTLKLTERLKAGEGNGGPILDAGDSDGLLLTAMGLAHRGVSLNLLDVCVRSSRSRGLAAVRADIEELPFEDRTFDAVFCFEAVEHLENPIHGLRELARVTRHRLYITVPYVESTRIHEDNYTRHLPKPDPEPEHHVFEFCPEDMRKILTHTGLEILQYDKLDIFGPIRRPWHRFFLRAFYDPSFFPAFQFYELAPKGNPWVRTLPSGGWREHH